MPQDWRSSSVREKGVCIHDMIVHRIRIADRNIGARAFARRRLDAVSLLCEREENDNEGNNGVRHLGRRSLSGVSRQLVVRVRVSYQSPW